MSYASGDVYDMIADQGATFSRAIMLKSPAKKPVPIPNYTAWMEVKPSASSTEVTLSLTTENSRIAILPNEGRVDLKVSAEDMSALTAGSYVYDLELTDTDSGSVTRILQGKFTIRPEITK
jgi:hypothetical protein